MSDDLQAVKDDIAFLRDLASEDKPLARQSAMLLAVGVIFACVDVFYWLLSSHRVSAHGLVEHLPWMLGTLVLFVAFAVINKRIPRSPGVAARAIGAAAAGVGYGVMAAVAAIILGSAAMGQPALVTSMLPIVLLTLYGAVWIVAFAVKRQVWLAAIAVGCFAATIVCGLVMGKPEEWLVLAAGMIFLVAVPGGVLFFHGRS